MAKNTPTRTVKKTHEKSEAKSSGFSLEMKSRKHLRQVNLSNGPNEAVLIEGDLGRIRRASFFEDKVLVIEGRYGTLSIELPQRTLSSKEVDAGMHGDVWW
jgi:hypothetical protein